MTNGAGTETVVADGDFAMCLSGGTRQTFKWRGDGGDGEKGGFAMRHSLSTRQSLKLYHVPCRRHTAKFGTFAVCCPTAHGKLSLRVDRKGHFDV